MLLTKFLLTAIAVQVNPEFTTDIIFHTGVFLIVKSIQSTTDNRIHLSGKVRSLIEGKLYNNLKATSASETRFLDQKQTKLQLLKN